MRSTFTDDEWRQFGWMMRGWESEERLSAIAEFQRQLREEDAIDAAHNVERLRYCNDRD